MVKKEWYAVILVTKTASPFARAYALKRGFSGNKNSFFYTLLGWVPIVLAALSSINRTVFCKISSALSRGFRERIESAVVARRNRLLSCNSETV